MLIRIYPENTNPREMAKALKMLRDGELIIYPTDTVYARNWCSKMVMWWITKRH